MCKEDILCTSLRSWNKKMNKTKPLKIFMVHWKKESCIIMLLQWKHSLEKRFSTLATQYNPVKSILSILIFGPTQTTESKSLSGAQTSIFKKIFPGNYSMEPDWKFCWKFKFKIHKTLITVWLSLSSSENWPYSKDFNIGNLLGSDSRRPCQRIGEVR